MKPPFQLFGTAHLTMLLVGLAGLVLLVRYLKTGGVVQNRRRDVRVFTVVFLLIELALIGSKIAAGEWTMQYNLPLHLCDISAVTILFALFTRSRLAFQLGWFWGLTGGLMAVLLPNLQFVDWYFVPFFIWHLFLIAGPVYQLYSDGYRLDYRSIYTALGITVVLGAVMFVVNRQLGSNYMFVNEKISSFDAIGLPGFPAYLPYLLVLALVMFHLMWGVSLLLKRG
jgi:hypothetical integral membrane protein (TIGR02206 family)